MSNMSYCRFQNTSQDLADCDEALDGLLNHCGGYSLSDRELEAAVDLIERCKSVLFKVEAHLTGNGIEMESIMDYTNSREIRNQLSACSVAIEVMEKEEEGYEDADEPPC